MDFGFFLLIFVTILLGKSLADLRGPVTRKKALAESGAIIGLGLLAFGWLIYDQERPYTGLAALVYSEATIAERKAADQEIKEFQRVLASIISTYQDSPD